MTDDHFAVDDEVAIVPRLDSPPEHVMEIARIAYLDDHTLHLTDHRMYSRAHRWGLTSSSQGYLVLATHEHRNALHRDRQSWCRRAPIRFSLRAMLIATTLVAVVLGLGVWLAR